MCFIKAKKYRKSSKPIDGETKKELQGINLNIDSFLKEAVAVLENQDFDNVAKTIKELLPVILIVYEHLYLLFQVFQCF